MTESGKFSSELAPTAEVMEILRKLRGWTLAENGNVLEGRYFVEDESAALRLISQTSYLAYWQGWPLSRIGYRECSIFFRLGSSHQAGVTRGQLLQATAIHAFSLPEKVPADPRAEADRGDRFDISPVATHQQLSATLDAIMAEHPAALRLAENTLISACRLTPTEVPDVLVIDYISDAWSQVGLAAALAGDLQRARVAVRLSGRVQTEGSGDPETQALTLMARAAILGLADPQTALRSIVHAQSLLTEIGGSSLLGWIFIRKGFLLLELNLQGAAAEALREGLRHTDPSGQPALFQRAHEALEQIEHEGESAYPASNPQPGEDLPN